MIRIMLQDILSALNLVGIVSFSISGSLKAFEKKLDLLGVFVLGFSTALAGGIIRDILLGIYPPTNLRVMDYPLLAILGSVLAVFFYRYIENLSKALLIADAIGLGTFTATGAEIAIEHGLNVIGVAILASITAVGGGVVRDLLSNEVPSVLKRDFYATPTILGGLIFYPSYSLLGGSSALISTFVFVTVLRIVAILRKWELPKVGLSR
ncbi:trimeric intracellular cation channel family protein [Metallosphaera sedula]